MHVKWLSGVAVIGLSASLVVVSGCSGEKSKDAPPAGNTGGKAKTPAPPEKPVEEPAKAAPAATLAQAWNFETKGQQTVLLGIVDGQVYATAGPYLEHGNPTRWVYRLDASTGAEKWVFDAGETLLASADLSAPGQLRFQDANADEATVIALDRETGARAEEPATSAPTAPNSERMTCTAEGAKLTCQGANGAGAWSHQATHPIERLQVAGERVCYATGPDRSIHCRGAASGKSSWSHPVPAAPKVKNPKAVDFSFGLTDSLLIVANYDGAVTAYKLP